MLRPAPPAVFSITSIYRDEGIRFGSVVEVVCGDSQDRTSSPNHCQTSSHQHERLNGGSPHQAMLMDRAGGLLVFYLAPRAVPTVSGYMVESHQFARGARQSEHHHDPRLETAHLVWVRAVEPSSSVGWRRSDDLSTRATGSISGTRRPSARSAEQWQLWRVRYRSSEGGRFHRLRLVGDTPLRS